MTLRLRTRWAALFIAVVAALLSGTAAWAYLSVSTTGTGGAAKAASVQAGVAPTGSANIRTVSLEWGASTLSNGQAVSGYLIKRYPEGSDSAQTLHGSCASTVSGLTCNDTSVPSGDWKYTVTPLFSTNWRGAESSKSETISIGGGALALDQTRLGSADFSGGSATLSGTLSGFDANETITFHLDSASGTALSGSPANADPSGNATVSVTLPQPSEGTHTIYAVGDASGANSSAASSAILVDLTAPAGGNLSGSTTSISGTFDLTRDDYAETAGATSSGLAGSTLTRATGTLSANSCSAFGSESAAIAGAPSEDSLGTGCYRYTLKGTDNVGNADSTTLTVKVDRTDPGAPSLTLSSATGSTFVNGTTVYTNPQAGKSGSFQVSATSVDADSGIAKVAFPTLTGYTSGGGDDASAPFAASYAWSGVGATASGAQTVTAHNGLSRTATSTFTVVTDAAAPTGGSVTVPSTTNTTGAYTVTRADYADAGSGLSSSTLTRATATLTGTTCGAYGAEAAQPAGNVSESNLATGCYRYTLTGTDNVGNAAFTSTTVQVNRASVLSISSVARDGGNKKVRFTGTGAAAGTQITVTICTVNSFPCPSANTVSTATATNPTAGAWTSAQNSDNLSQSQTYWAQAVQGAATSSVFTFSTTSL